MTGILRLVTYNDANGETTSETIFGINKPNDGNILPQTRTGMTNDVAGKPQTTAKPDDDNSSQHSKVRGIDMIIALLA